MCSSAASVWLWVPPGMGVGRYSCYTITSCEFEASVASNSWIPGHRSYIVRPCVLGQGVENVQNHLLIWLFCRKIGRWNNEKDFFFSLLPIFFLIFYLFCSFSNLFCLLVLFEIGARFCSFGRPGTHCVDQVDLEGREILSVFLKCFC